MVSDGSFFPTKSQASGAWILGNEARHRSIIGKCPCAGNKHHHSAYRAELAGLYSGLLFLKHLCTYKDINNGKIIIGCDGLSALRKIQRIPSLSSKHYDYLSSLNSLLKDIPLTVQFLHVKGHLDATTDIENLSTVEQMNIQADQLAKQANEVDYSNPQLEHLPLYNEYGPVSFQDGSSTKISSHLKKTLYSKLTEKPTREYWIKKMKIPPTAAPSTDWKSLSTAFQSLPTPRKTEIVKWNSEFCGTGKNLHRWQEQSHSNCPTCGAPNEDTTHILQCPHPTAKQQWENSLNSLNNWLNRSSTHPDIAHIIIENLRAWQSHRPSVLYNGSLPHLSDAQQSQSSIGWETVLRGFISTKWSATQNLHFQHLQSKKTGKRWVTELIKKLWQVSWDMWRFRNGILHHQSNATPTNFTFLLTSSILSEINHGHRLLPISCSYLFAKPAAELLRSTVNSKKLWLATVWAARDFYSPADTICQNRNKEVSAYVESWRKKNRN